MKCLFLSALLSCMFCNVFSQAKVPPTDKSPLDISYYPANYPLLKIQDKAGPLLARVIYSRPQKSGRAIFGELIEFGKLWRLGANEATEIEFFQPVTIGNQKLKKGRYTIYVIPDSAKWTFIINRDTDTWGSFRYDQKKDLVRVDVKPVRTEEETEYFSMYFDKIAGLVNLVVAWDKTLAMLPIKQ